MGLAVCCMRSSLPQQSRDTEFVHPKVSALCIPQQSRPVQKINTATLDTAERTGVSVRGPVSTFSQACKQLSSMKIEDSWNANREQKASVDSETVQHKLVRDIMCPDEPAAVSSPKSKSDSNSPPALASPSNTKQKRISAGSKSFQQPASRLIEVQPNPKHDISIGSFEDPNHIFSQPLQYSATHLESPTFPKQLESNTPVSLKKTRFSIFERALSSSQSSNSPKPTIFVANCGKGYQQKPARVIHDTIIDNPPSLVFNSLSWLSVKYDNLIEESDQLSGGDLHEEFARNQLKRTIQSPEVVVKVATQLDSPEPNHLHNELDLITLCRLNHKQIARNSQNNPISPARH